MVKRVGCRSTAQVGMAIHFVGILIMTFCGNYHTLVAGQLLVGAGMAMAYVVVNQYLVELSPKAERGAAAMRFDVSP